MTNFVIDSDCGGKNYFGWPCNAEVEKLRADYMKEADPAKQRAILDDLSRSLWGSLPAILTGEYFSPVAVRMKISRLIRANMLAFGNLEKKA